MRKADIQNIVAEMFARGEKLCPQTKQPARGWTETEYRERVIGAVVLSYAERLHKAMEAKFR